MEIFFEDRGGWCCSQGTNHVRSPQKLQSPLFLIKVVRRRFIFAHIQIHFQPVCPLSWSLNPGKKGHVHSKQGSFGFQLYISI